MKGVRERGEKSGRSEEDVKGEGRKRMCERSVRW